MVQLKHSMILFCNLRRGNMECQLVPMKFTL